MAELREAGAIGFSDDGVPIRSARVMRRALSYQRLCGGVIALHEEDPELSGSGVMHEGPVSATLGLSGIPSISESTMIARDAAIAAYEEARIHVQHLSATESVEAVRAAKEAGVAISCEATPHHLCLTDEAVRSLDASRHKMNPPLRAESDRQSLLAGLRDGTIDCIATDHAPHLAEEKEVPFEAAAMGVTGLETAFAAIHTYLVVPGVLPLELADREARLRRRALRRVARDPRPRQRGQHRPLRPRRGVGRGGGRLREPLRQLLVRRRDPARAGADDDRRRGRSPTGCAASRWEWRDAEGGARGEARAREGGAGRGRRAGGVPQGGPRLRRGRRGRRDRWCGERRRWGCRSSSPSSTRRGSARPFQPSPSTCLRGSSRSRRCASPPPRPTASTSAAASQALVCGIETHVCVNQTVLDLLERGLEVQVVARRGRLAQRREPRAGAAAGGARRGPTSPASRWRCSSCSVAPTRPSSSRSRSWSSERRGRIRAARGRGPLRWGCLRRRRRGARRGRLQHLDDRLPGGGHRPLLRGPGHHLHLPADRQLRRLGRGDGVRPGPRPGGDHA